jgi:lysophospholipase L1-like esterase
MKIIYKTLYRLLFVSAVVIAFSCENDDIPMMEEDTQEVPLTAGSANLSNYVSLGNSLTAGFTDGALFALAQQNSFPNLMAGKFALAGGGQFTQPIMADNVGGLLLGGVQIQGPRLYFDGSGPAPVSGTPTTEVSNILTGPFNNLGVPGAKSFHLLANGYGNIAGVPVGAANPYFARMASSPNASIVEDAVAQNPTFFTLWIGSNDVLSYATSGGSGVNQAGNPDVTTYGGNDITDPGAFSVIYSNIVDALTSNGAQGVLLNIPYVINIPFFTTIPYNPVPLDAATAALVNGAYQPYNAGLLQALAAGLLTQEEVDRRTISFSEGQNSVVLIDEYLTDLTALGLPSYRQSTPEDRLPLTAASFVGTTVNNDPTLINGVTVPLEDRWVFSVDEEAEVLVATDAFNATIEQVAASKGLPLLDANAIVEQVFETGLQFDEFELNGSLVFGGIFSLDGIHPTARGNAFVANEVLKLIDATYGSNFEEAGQLLKARDFTTFYPEVLPDLVP